MLVSHEAGLYWLSATLSSLFFAASDGMNGTVPISNFTSAESIIQIVRRFSSAKKLPGFISTSGLSIHGPVEPSPPALRNAHRRGAVSITDRNGSRLGRADVWRRIFRTNSLPHSYRPARDRPGRQSNQERSATKQPVAARS